jgi:hypothetical protein
VVDRAQAAVGVGADADLLVGRWPEGGGLEDLVSGQDDPHGTCEPLSGHRGEDHLGAARSLASETPADMLGADVHPVLVDGPQRGQNLGHAESTLVGIDGVQVTVVPPRR